MLHVYLFSRIIIRDGCYLDGSHVTGQLVHSLLFSLLPCHESGQHSQGPAANQLIDNHDNLIVTHASY